MMRKILWLLLALFLLAGLVSLWFYSLGTGFLGGEGWQSGAPAAGPRPAMQQPITDQGREAQPQILFGDLHTHTNYSLDAYIFNSGLMKEIGVVTPADACDFARYCSALDFWSINDHAESLSPRAWADTVEAVRACNAQAGDAQNPDMVSFVGWEWSNGDRDDIPSHYGHKNVIFRTWEEGATPVRPIASQQMYALNRVPAVLRGMMSLSDELKATADFGWYANEVGNVPACDRGLHSSELPADCREVADTPTDLYRKLDELGLDSMVIPHGLAWGTTNPLTADFRNQLDQFEQRYQRLVETYSGHGNSERFEDFQRIAEDAQGNLYCPPATENFLPCCQRAAELVRASCAVPESAACEQQVKSTVGEFLAMGVPAGRKLIEGATLNDWVGCGQLQNSFQPASMYVPRQTTQYNLALGFDSKGNPKRARFGLIGSSDNHVARPGNSYKELNRPLMTDNKAVSGESNWALSADKESGGFYYTGGLVAVHANGRNRDAIWDALHSREVYATSGDRMLVWFDLLNGPQGKAPMGSEVSMAQAPHFKVSALGAFEQQAGCPEYTLAALGQSRTSSLCGNECYRPGDKRKAITRIEIVRVRPQIHPEEPMESLIDHRWKVFDCADKGQDEGDGCSIEFTDEEYMKDPRDTVYYARVIQQPEPLISGDPFGCEYDEQGNCMSRRYCIDENAPADEDCTATAEPRAWTSPIFVEFPGS